RPRRDLLLSAKRCCRRRRRLHPCPAWRGGPVPGRDRVRSLRRCATAERRWARAMRLPWVISCELAPSSQSPDHASSPGCVSALAQSARSALLATTFDDCSTPARYTIWTSTASGETMTQRQELGSYGQFCP